MNYSEWELHFNPLTHQYERINIKTGESVELLSATQLMKKHGLSVDYSEVPTHILENARIFGDAMHKSLEEYFKGIKNYDETFDIIKSGLDLLEASGFTSFANELKVFNKWFAGTIDMLAMKDDDLVLVDFKFTYNLNAHSIMWQLNIYRRLIRENLHYEIKKLYVLWYNKPEKKFELREVELIPDDLIETLFKAELNGDTFIDNQNDLMTIIEKQLAVDRELLKLHNADTLAKEIKIQVDVLKEELLNEMERLGLISYETDNFSITRVLESKRKTYDNARLRRDVRDKVDLRNYLTETITKSHLRISKKTKEDKR